VKETAERSRRMSSLTKLQSSTRCGGAKPFSAFNTSVAILNSTWRRLAASVVLVERTVWYVCVALPLAGGKVGFSVRVVDWLQLYQCVVVIGCMSVCMCGCCRFVWHSGLPRSWTVASKHVWQGARLRSTCWHVSNFFHDWTLGHFYAAIWE